MMAVDNAVKHGEQHDAHNIAGDETCGDGKRLVMEYGTGDSAHKHQRHEYGYRGERRWEHRRYHLWCTGVARIYQSVAALTVLCDIFGDDYRVVNHHANRENQSRQRDDVDWHPEKEEQQKRDDDRRDNAHSDDHGGAHIAHEQSREDEHQQKSEYQVLHEIGYGVVEQLCLVAALRELDLRI